MVSNRLAIISKTISGVITTIIESMRLGGRMIFTNGSSQIRRKLRNRPRTSNTLRTSHIKKIRAATLIDALLPHITQNYL
jgi:hypothetical protein